MYGRWINIDAKYIKEMKIAIFYYGVLNCSIIGAGLIDYYYFFIQRRNATNSTKYSADEVTICG